VADSLCQPVPTRFGKGKVRGHGVAFQKLVPAVAAMARRGDQELDPSAPERDRPSQLDERAVLISFNDLAYEWSGTEFCLPLPRVRYDQFNQVITLHSATVHCPRDSYRSTSLKAKMQADMLTFPNLHKCNLGLSLWSDAARENLPALRASGGCRG
jgi:hypothetical protein